MVAALDNNSASRDGVHESASRFAGSIVEIRYLSKFGKHFLTGPFPDFYMGLPAKGMKPEMGPLTLACKIAGQSRR